MSDQTFEQLWRRLLVYAPDCPVPLAQEFINTAYSRALVAHGWTGLRVDQTFYIPDVYETGTVDVTQNDTAVDGLGTAFTSAMIGRQFYIPGESSYYTIVGVPNGVTLTLDREWEPASQTGLEYQIAQVYLEFPEDIQEIISVRDIPNNWRLHTNMGVEELDVIDTERSTTGTPWLLAYGVPFNSSRRPRWELWPRGTEETSYEVRYIEKPALMSATSDRAIYPIRGDILRSGALAELCKWPGTIKSPNPFFSLEQHALWEQQFQAELHRAKTEDQNFSQRTIGYVGWDNLRFAPVDAAFIQEHGGEVFLEV